MGIVFLTVDEVNRAHERQLAAHGGSSGIRDIGLLQSALGMPQAGFGGQFLHGFPHEMAAAYLFHIASNHPFIDGNKRAALAAALIFLEVNDVAFTATRDETYALVIDVAAGKIDKSAVAAFFKQHVKPR